MEAKAVAKYVRIAPRKAQAVADLIRGKSYPEALTILRFTQRRASGVLEKVVRSAGANAKNNYDLNPQDLFIAEAYVDQGPTLKRILPRARGMADRIRKRTSHITVVLRERE
ncbi:MAG TPA: 50S ribosomal protein L22 [Firmicutes bacterium]|jgi:large subunit ribosomal protein L22|nr:50S ribosomal protein L22 [Bacillota bacterium]